MEETKKYKIIIRAPQQYQYTRERYQQTVVYHPVSLATNVYQEHIHGIYPAVLISPCCACVVDLSPYAVLRTHPLLRQQPGLASQSAGRLEEKKKLRPCGRCSCNRHFVSTLFLCKACLPSPKGVDGLPPAMALGSRFHPECFVVHENLVGLVEAISRGKKSNEKRKTPITRAVSFAGLSPQVVPVVE